MNRAIRPLQSEQGSLSTRGSRPHIFAAHGKSGAELRVEAELQQLRDLLRRFAEDRDWDQFHSPKNLASALIVEAGELLERFQWLTEEQSRNLSAEQRAKVADELADVFVYVIRLADKLGFDLMAITQEKIAKNAQKYPIEKARGNAKKYTEL